MHVAIIMDGNGRWASQRGLPRTAGHRVGAQAVDRVVTAAASNGGVKVLTLYAFSQANWQRPLAEVRGLFRLFRSYLKEQTSRCVEQSIRLNVIGRRDRLDASAARPDPGGRASHGALHAHGSANRGRLLRAMEFDAGVSLISRACLDRSSTIRAAAGSGRSRHSRSATWILLIRTGGEQRMSDFMLWECAYAELHFVPRLWPDFDADDFEAALTEFSRRDRRFGAASAPTDAVSVQHG